MSEPRPRPVLSRSDRLARRKLARRKRRAGRWRGALALLAGLLVTAAAITAAVLTLRPESPAPRGASMRANAAITDASVGAALVRDASAAVVTVSSFDYRDLDAARTRGLEVSTGAYQDAYRSSLDGALGTTARRERLIQTLTVRRAGLGEQTAGGSSAKVLVFGTQTITSHTATGAVQDSNSTPTTLTASVVRDAATGTVRIARLDLGANAGLPSGTAALRAAAEAGRSQVLRMLSYRRAEFDADYERALAGAAEPLRTTLAGNRGDTEAALRDGGYDLTGRVTAVAVESALGDTVVMLVAATGSRVSADGTAGDATDSRLAVTVVAVDDGWRVSRVEQVDVS